MRVLLPVVKESGQIVLFRFPRADLSEGKLRPALLLSEVPGAYEDWLICMISSQVHQRIDGFDELIEEATRILPVRDSR